MLIWHSWGLVLYYSKLTILYIIIHLRYRCCLKQFVIKSISKLHIGCHSYKLWFLYFFFLLVFKDLITVEINNNSKVVVIAASKSHDSLHPSLLTSRGCHIFQCCVELHPPDNDQRKQILYAMIRKRFPLQDPEGLELR